MRQYILFIVFIFLQCNLSGQKLLIDSTYHYGSLYLRDAKILRLPHRPPPDSLIRLFSDDSPPDIFYLKFRSSKDVIRIYESAFILDSSYCRSAFRNLVYSAISKKGADLKITPVRTTEFANTEPIEQQEPTDSLKKYNAELDVSIPFVLSNSIASFVIPTSLLSYDTSTITGVKRPFYLKIKKVTFKKKCQFVYNNYLNFTIRNALFRDSVIISINDNLDYFGEVRPTSKPGSARVNFFNSVFDSSFVLFHHDSFEEPTNQYNPYEGYYPEYQNADFSIPYAFNKIAFTRTVFHADVIFQTRRLDRVVFNQCEFNGSLFLNSKILDTCTFNSCVFQNFVDLRNTQFTRGTSLKGSYFKKYSTILVTKDDPVEKWGIDITSFEKVFFIIDWGWETGSQYVYWDALNKTFKIRKFQSGFDSGDSLVNPFADFRQEDLEVVKLKYRQINDYIKTNFKSDDLLGSNQQKVSNWFFYQAKQYEKVYYKQHSPFRYYWLCFLERVVNFGYEGETNFFTACLGLVFVFCLLYKIFYQEQINSHLNKEHETSKSENYFTRGEKRSGWKSLLLFFNLDFFKSLYFSFIIFFSPKFYSSYFNFSKGLASMIIIEWCLGIFFIVLFLIYIAGNYPIITKLLGM